MSDKPNTISEDTPVRMPLGRFWAIFVATVTIAGGGAIYGTNLLRDIRDEMKHLNTAVATSWTVAQQERWAARLRWENRSVPLAVPDPHDIPR